jgi:hypothetical protein
MNGDLRIERLEERVLLSVNVMKQGNTLILTGDGAGDDVEILGQQELYKVEIRVNGAHKGTFNGVQDLIANLGAGDDSLSLYGVKADDVTAHLGLGNDTFLISTSSDHPDPDDGNVDLGAVVVTMGGQDGDQILVTHDPAAGERLAFGNSVTIFGAPTVQFLGLGSDPADNSEPGDIQILGNLTILTPLPNRRSASPTSLVRLSDVWVGNNTTILSLPGRDSVFQIRDSEFVGDVRILDGGGDDLLELGDSSGRVDQSNIFHARVRVNLGSGSDTVFDAPGNSFAVPPEFDNVETFL